MRNKHIAPEEADHAENIDDRADDKKRSHVILCNRSAQLDQREYNSITQIRKKIERRSNAIAFLFIVVVADEVIRLPPRNVEYKEDAQTADDQHRDPQYDTSVEVFKHLCPVAEIIGARLIKNAVAQEVAETHAEMHQGHQQNERSAQRSEFALLENDQQDEADNDVHQRGRARVHDFPEDVVDICGRVDRIGTAESKQHRFGASDHLRQQMGCLVHGSGQVHRDDPQCQTVEDHKKSVVLFRFIHDYFLL